MLEDLYAETVLLKALSIHTLAELARTQRDPAAFMAHCRQGIVATIQGAAIIDVPDADKVRAAALAKADQLLNAVSLSR